MKNFETEKKSQLILRNGSKEVVVDLYSKEGGELINSLYLKLATEFQWMYLPKWLGRPIIQVPHDIVIMQELLWNIQPDVIVECGVAHGGSLILSASICQLIGKGKVIGVDVEIRPHNREAIEKHFLSPRIELIEGSSVLPETVAKVKDKLGDAKVVLVILDSNHTREHVLKELEMYHSMVSVGSYIVAMDGAQAYVGDIPRAKDHWKNDHPIQAIHEFLKTHSEFEIDREYEKLGVTCSPDGFLKRLK
jgi:cephalosporin hydroxylase